MKSLLFALLICNVYGAIVNNLGPNAIVDTIDMVIRYAAYTIFTIYSGFAVIVIVACCAVYFLANDNDLLQLFNEKTEGQSSK